jgi:hypothetical protein
MPILDMQIRMRELGRIRTGNQVVAGNGRKRPNKLSTFRLTSASSELIEAAAQVYGGTVVPWDSPAGHEFEVVIEAPSLPIVIPPGQQLSQWYEMWTAAGCTRRCDGRTNVISDGPCECPADATERRELASANPPGACKPTTRLSVLLPDLPDLGMWRLESHGYYAAVELAGAAQFLAIASARGMNIPASLRLEQREKKVPGRPTNRYAVPVIEFTTTRIADLLAAGSASAELPLLGEPTGAPQLAPGSLAPTKSQRARQPKGERPALGPAPTAPSGDGFGKPTPPAPAAVAPPLAGGWPVETAQDAPGASDGGSQLPESTPTADVAGDPAPEADAPAWAASDDAPSLVARLQASVADSALVGPISDPQKDKLRSIIGRPSGLDWASEVLPVLVEAFGEGFLPDEMLASQANALISIAGRDGQEAFVEAWRSCVPVSA